MGKKIFELTNDGKLDIDFDRYIMLRFNKAVKEYSILNFLKRKKVKVSSKEFFEKNKIYLDTGIITITAPNKEEFKLIVKRKGKGYGWKITEASFLPDTVNLLQTDKKSQKLFYFFINELVKNYIDKKIKPIMEQNIKRLERELQV